MTQPDTLDQDILDQDIRALQEWLRAAWRRLSEPSLTAFESRELRNQMKHCNADLRACLQRAGELQAGQNAGAERVFARPDMRILA